MAEGPPSERLVWTGRHEAALPGGLDGWTTSNDELAARVAVAGEIVVLDPLSFPWSVLGSGGRDVPVFTWLPPELDGDDLVRLLGRPLLAHLTPFDRVVEPRPHVRAHLERELGLTPRVWLSAPDGSDEPDEADGSDPPWTAPLAAHLRERPDPAALRGKRHLRQVAEVVSHELRSWAGRCVGPTLVGVVGRAGDLLPTLATLTDLEVQHQPVGDDDPGPDLPALIVPSPGAAVVWLDDGGQGHASRRETLRAAAQCLHPGGRLVVVAYVVDEVGGRANPRTSTLVEELLLATASAVHVEELRSVRWHGDQLSRGLLLGITSLRGVPL